MAHRSANYEVSPNQVHADHRYFTEELETTCYGEIEFVGPGSGCGQESRKFVKVDSETDCEKLVHVLKNVWNLGSPNLLISVTGGADNFKVNSRLREVFRKGIVEAAVSTRAWIISGGTYTGVMKYVGEAVRDYEKDCRTNDVVAIGIASWGVLDQRDSLLDTENIGGNRLVHVSTTKQDGEEKVVLDPNHTHFILVDDGSEGQVGVEIKLRANLEKDLATTRRISLSKKDAQDIHIPAVCIAIEGGINTIQTVYEAIHNDTPVIIVAESGRASDAMTLAFQRAELSEDGQELDLPPTIESAVIQLLHKLKDGISQEELDKCMANIKHCLKKPHLLNVFDHSFGMDITGSVLKALLKANQDHQEVQLFLAQALNQVDIASSELFGAGSKVWKEDKLDRNLRYALVNNQPDFVQLLLENGVSLKAYLTKKELKDLYNEVKENSLLHQLLHKVRAEVKENSLWHQLLHKVRAEVMIRDYDREFNLQDVSRVIKLLTAMPDSELRYKTDAVHGENDTDIAESTIQTPGLRRKFSAKAARPEFSDPATELFLYAVLNQFGEMARIFWEMGKENMASALTASAVFYNMAKRCQSWNEELMERLINLSKEYENLAINIQTECYNQNRRLTSLLLIRELHNWGRETCLSLAVAGKNFNFIAHSGVQHLLKEIWYFGTSDKNNIIKLWLCSIMPFAVPRFVTYRPDLANSSLDDAKAPIKVTGETNHGYEEESISMRTIARSKEAPYSVKPGGTAKFLSTRQTTNIGIVLTGDRVLTSEQKIKFFYISPRMTFKLNALFYVLFLALYSYFMLSGTLTKLSPARWEYILFVWVGIMFIELFRQAAHEEGKAWSLRILQCMTSGWNRVDMVLFLFFGVAIPFRFFESTLYVARLIWAFDLVGFYIRTVKNFAYSRKLGPKIVMLREMFLDMLFFIFIFLVFLVGFGIAMAAIQYPNSFDATTTFRVVLYRPYFQIYGELFLEEITAKQGDGACTFNPTEVENDVPLCPQNTIAATVLLAVYLCISNILLLTLLVAMFSYTFQRIQEKSDILWKYQRYTLTKEFFHREILPPPLVIFVYIALVVRKWSHRCGSFMKWRHEKMVVQLAETHAGKLINWEARQADKYISRQRQKMKDVVDERVRSSNNRSVSDSVDLANGISSRLTNVENQLRKTAEAINVMMRSLEEQNLLFQRLKPTSLQPPESHLDSSA